MKTVLCSACLVGEPCRYDGRSKPLDGELLRELRAVCRLVPVCPEIMGGLSTPRPPAEIRPSDGRVINAHGEDVTEAFKRGAAITAQKAKAEHAVAVILKDRSPSCGVNAVYDGAFCGRLIEGMGVTAALLKANGFAVFDETRVPEAVASLKERS